MRPWIHLCVEETGTREWLQFSSHLIYTQLYVPLYVILSLTEEERRALPLPSACVLRAPGLPPRTPPQGVSFSPLTSLPCSCSSLALLRQTRNTLKNVIPWFWPPHSRPTSFLEASQLLPPSYLPLNVLKDELICMVSDLFIPQFTEIWFLTAFGTVPLSHQSMTSE